MSDQHQNLMVDSRSFEMEEKKGPSVSVVSIPPEYDSRPLLPGLNQPNLTPHNWPSQPEPLIESRAAAIWLDLYDVFLCILPLALMVKATLCIVARHLDYQLSMKVLFGPSGMTSFLSPVMLWINEQVCTQVCEI